jgi:hypothetical protein
MRDATYFGVKTCIWVGMTIGSSIGWWLGDYVGIMTALLVSGIGGIAGVYGGWRFARWQYLE